LAGADELVDELHVADHTILIFSDSEEGEKVGGFALLQLLAEGAQHVLDLSHGHFSGAVFVEDLEALDVVLFASCVLQVGFDIGPNRKEVRECHALLAKLGSCSGRYASGVGAIAAQSAENIGDVEGVHIVALIGFVEDDEGVFGIGFRHLECVFVVVVLFEVKIKQLKERCPLRSPSLAGDFHLRRESEEPGFYMP